MFVLVFFSCIAHLEQDCRSLGKQENNSHSFSLEGDGYKWISVENSDNGGGGFSRSGDVHLGRGMANWAP